MAGQRDIEAGRAFVRLWLKNDLTKQLSGALNSAGQKMQTWGRGIQKVGLPIAAAGGAITAAFAGAVGHFAAVGDELDKMSKRTGVAAPALAGLGFAAEQSGASLEDVEKGLKRQSKIIRDYERGLSTAVEAFDTLGISFAEIQSLAPEDQFDLIAERIAGIEDPTKRAAMAQEVWGRAGTMLIPMLGDLKALKAEAQELGIIPTEEEVENAAKVTDAINRVKRTVSAAFFNIGASIAEPVLEGLDAVKRIAAATSEWVRNNKPLIKMLAMIGVGLLAAGGAMVAFGAAVPCSCRKGHIWRDQRCVDGGRFETGRSNCDYRATGGVAGRARSANVCLR